MILTGARRCIPLRACATWCDAFAQRCKFSTTPTSAKQQHRRRQHLRDSGVTKGQVEADGVSGKPARRGNGLSEPEPEPDLGWTLEKDQYPPLAEQEAQFSRDVRNGSFTCYIMQRCLACGMPHGLTICPSVFEDSRFQDQRLRGGQRLFEKRMASSQEFRDTVAYFRRVFVHKMPSGGHRCKVPLSKTQDAPPLAKGKKTELFDLAVLETNLHLTSMTLIVTEWLRNFDPVVHFNVGRHIEYDSWSYITPAYSYLPGHYSTTDDDGRPFVIIWTNSGHYDTRMPYGMCFLPLSSDPASSYIRINTTAYRACFVSRLSK